jgi:hypothetical protein
MSTSEKRFGVWNGVQKRFVFGINEDSPKKAAQKLRDKIGKDSMKWRYEVRTIPPNWHNPVNPNYKK